MRIFCQILSISFLFLTQAVAGPQVKIEFKLSPAGKFSAESKEVKGVAVLSGDKVTAENIILPLKSLNSGIELRDDHMKNKYLKVSEHPDAILVRGEGSAGKGIGKFKIRGIEKEVPGSYTLNEKEVIAQFEIKLSDFGIEGIKYMGVGVNDRAQVSVTLPISKTEKEPKKAIKPMATPAPKTNMPASKK
jgi:hypothetical protein